MRATGEAVTRGPWWCLTAIIAFAAILRFYAAIATPLVYDEYQWTARVDTVRFRPGDIHLPIHGDQHPPGQLYWSAWGTTLFGDNLVGYRIGSVILGTLAVPIAFRLGMLYFGATAGLLAAFLVATNEYWIGAVSRLCTEKTYLTFALASLLLFELAVRRKTRTAFVALGVCFGLGLMTKQTLALWAPLFALELVRRPEARALWRTAAPYLAAATCLIVIAPSVYWNWLHRADWTYYDSGVAFQLTKLGLGWNWGPTALFGRFLIYLRLEPGVFDYPAHTALTGGLLMLGAVSSLLVLRSPGARFCQLLGFGTFAFFSLFGNYPDDYPAFWWADLTILPFTMLLAGAVGQLTTARRTFLLLVVTSFIVGAAQVVRVHDNVYLPLVARPPEAVRVKARNERMRLGVSERTWGARAEAVDVVELCRIGPWRLPAWHYYDEAYRTYRNELDAMSASARASLVDWRSERETVEATIQRFAHDR